MNQIKVGDLVAHRYYPTKSLGQVQELCKNNQVRVTNQPCLFQRSDLVVLSEPRTVVTQDFKVGDVVAYKTHPSRILGRICKFYSGGRIGLYGDQESKITYSAKNLILVQASAIASQQSTVNN